MFLDGDVFRLDVPARESVAEFTLWLNAVLSEEREEFVSIYLFLCYSNIMFSHRKEGREGVTS